MFCIILLLSPSSLYMTSHALWPSPYEVAKSATLQLCLTAQSGQDKKANNWKARKRKWCHHYHKGKCLIWQLQNLLSLFQKLINQWCKSCSTCYPQRSCHIVSRPHQYDDLKSDRAENKGFTFRNLIHAFLWPKDQAKNYRTQKSTGTIRPKTWESQNREQLPHLFKDTLLPTTHQE